MIRNPSGDAGVMVIMMDAESGSRVARTVAATLVGAACLLTDLVPARAAELTSAGGAGTRELAHTVAITVRGPVAEVETTQLFAGLDAAPAEGIYTFDLPAAAAIIGLSARLPGGRWATAQVIDAEAAVAPPPGARAAAVRGAADLALLRMVERGASTTSYELRLYPLARGKTVEVKLRWNTTMSWRDGRLVLRIPGRGDAANLVDERVRVQLAAAPPVQGWREVHVAGRSFPLARGPRPIEVTAKARGDLVVEAAPTWAARPPRLHLSFAAVPLGSGGGALAVHMAAPPARGSSSALAYERMVAVVDVSRSMGRDGVNAAEKLVRTLLYALPVSARVELLLYDRKVQRPLVGFPANDDRSKQAIADALSNAPLENGSDLGAGLDAVRLLLDKDEPPSGRRLVPATLVVVISDGLLALDLDEAQALHRIGERAVREADVLAIGLAPDDAALPGVDGGPLTALAVRSGGRSIAMRQGQVDARIQDLVAELSRPAPLERLALELPAGVTLAGLELPARIDAAEGAVAIGWYRGKAPPSSITLTAMAGGHPLRVTANGDSALKPKVAALALAGALEDDDQEQLFRAARKAGVVTPVSSMVALDPADALARDRLAMAARWNGAVFFRQSPPGSRAEALRVFEQVDEAADPTESAARRGGTLDRDIIGRLIETYVLPKAKICYDRALRTNHDLRGEATLLLELARGEVARAEIIESTFRGAAVETCLAEAGWSIHVPKVALGADSDVIDLVRYPLRFRRRGSEAEVSRREGDAVTVDLDDPLGEP